MRYLIVRRSGMRPAMKLTPEMLDSLMKASEEEEPEPETLRAPELAAWHARNMKSYPELRR